MAKIAPPAWRDNESYHLFKKELKMWQLATDLDPKKQAPFVIMQLKEKAKKVALEIPLEELSITDNGDGTTSGGIPRLLAELDKAFLKDVNEESYMAYDEFEKFRRNSGMSIQDYILEFERLLNRAKEYKMVLSENVLAYKVLNNAGLGKNHMELARATVKSMTFDDMKDTIRKIMGDCKEGSAFSISKSENETMYTMGGDYYECNQYKNDQSEMYGKDPDVEHDADYGEYDGEYDADYSEHHSGYGEVYYGNSFNRGRYNRGRRQNLRRNQTRGNNRYNYSNRGNYTDGHETKYNSSRQMNPLDRNGNISRCVICDSKMHWASKCPESYEARNRKKSVRFNDDIDKITLFQNTPNEDQMSLFVGENLGVAFLDSGCNRTVCGEDWYTSYIETLSEEERSTISKSPSEYKFKFGDNKSVPSLYRVKIPAQIGKIDVTIETDVIKDKIPLLMSRMSMKKAKMAIDFENDKITVFGTTQPLWFTTTGHYGIPITQNHVDNINICMCEESHDNMTFQTIIKKNKDSNQLARKLHKQFCHPSPKRLKDLLRSAGKQDEDLFKRIDEVSATCDTCLRFKKPATRPVVSFPLATSFNETVAMDLKEFRPGVYFQHMIDHATRYSAGSIVRSKHKETIIKSIFHEWISKFGCPLKFLSDNGGEYNNEQFRDMCANLNVHVLTTGAESPWSNGLVERHHAVIATSVEKIMEETKCDLETALCWAISAKNSLLNINGYSPNQLVFGSNPILPSLEVNKLPALECKTASEVVARNLNALHEARKQFIQADSSQRIQRALSHRTRNISGRDIEDYRNGDLVYFKRDKSNRWFGPGTVIGKEGKQVFVKLGGTWVRVHVCHLIKIEDFNLSDANGDKNRASEIPSYNTPNFDSSDTNEDENRPSKLQSDQPQSNNNYRLFPDLQELYNSCAESDIHYDTHISADIQIPTGENLEESSESPENTFIGPIRDMNILTDSIDRDDSCNSTINDACATNTKIIPVIELSDSMPCQFNKEIPKISSTINITLPDETEVRTMKVVSRAGKKRGKHSTFVNLEDTATKEKKCHDFRNINAWSYVLKENKSNTSTSDMEGSLTSAKAIELEKWKEYKVYSRVPADDGIQPISVRWVFVNKEIEGKVVPKARLVARGFQDSESSTKETFSPTCKRSSLRILFTVVATMKWKIQIIDITSAFLQGRPIDRDVYLVPPPEANEKDIYWKLNTCVYGLSDAARMWFLKVKDQLHNLDIEISQYDSALFYQHDTSGRGLSGIIGIHVDDIIWGGTEHFQQNVIRKIQDIFNVGKLEIGCFTYLGLNINQADDFSISVDQNDYTAQLKTIPLSNQRSQRRNDEVNENEFDQYRSGCGQLNWLSGQSRPDVSYDSCILSNRLSQPIIYDVKLYNKTVKKLKTSPCVILKYPSLQDFPDNCRIVCYSDASYGNLGDGGSQGGYIVFAEDQTGNRAPLTWRSKRLKRIARSTIAAEAQALVDGAGESLLLANIFKDIFKLDNILDIDCYIDSKSLFNNLNSSNLTLEDKTLVIDMAALREMIMKNGIRINWVKSSCMIADCLTKSGAATKSIIESLSHCNDNSLSTPSS